MGKKIILVFLLLLLIKFSYSQSKNFENSYPRVLGYICVLEPIVNWDLNGFTLNFENVYTVGFPIGINILKSDKIGFSFELTPYIMFEKGMSKVNNLLFHPGVRFQLPHNYAFIIRVAFETNGRYGITPIINKVFLRMKYLNYFVGIPAPIRIGNNKPFSIGLGILVGICF
jgi:hypothetical protein